MVDGSETHHIGMQMAQQQAQEVHAFYLGQVSTYDPKTHRAKVILCTFVGKDNKFMETGWLQVATLWSGLNFGMQLCPIGGATVEDLSKGEMVLVDVVYRNNTLYALGCFLYNQVDIAPGAKVPGLKSDGSDDYELKPGEALFKHKTGSLDAKLNDGSIHIVAQDKPNDKKENDQDPDESLRLLEIDCTTAKANNTSQGTINVHCKPGEGKESASIIDILSKAGKGDTAAATASFVVDSEDGTNNTADLVIKSSTAGSVAQSSLDISSESSMQSDLSIASKADQQSSASMTADAPAASLSLTSNGVQTSEVSLQAQGSTTAKMLITSAGSMNIQVVTTQTETIGEAKTTTTSEYTIIADTLVIQCPLTSIGDGFLQPLLKQAAADVFNVHTHEAPGGETGPPGDQILSTEMTVNLVAS